MTERKKTNSKEVNKAEKQLECGLVMPISAIDGCSEQHWHDVELILKEAINAAEFKANLVSDADDVGIIQKRIIQNLYDNPIIVCDVSAKNPNVMFELGLRLAFDKPTIIVKDDKTSYSFDTSSIEHLEYPRDLRFNKIVEFKHALTEKIKATHKKATEDPDYTTFLKHFGKFTVAKLETKEVSKDAYLLEEIQDIKKIILRNEIRDKFEERSNYQIKHANSKKDFLIRNCLRNTMQYLQDTGREVLLPDMESEIISLARGKFGLLLKDLFKTPEDCEKALKNHLYHDLPF